MKVLIRKEEGYELALEGIGLSFNLDDMGRLENVAERLAPKDGGHNKFLESIVVWLDINAPRYWWSEFDTYRVGTTKQSESTMHTITHRMLTQKDFEEPIIPYILRQINVLIQMYHDIKHQKDKDKIFREIKNNLPEGFLQRRIVCTNYKVLKNMVWQRKNHRLAEWRVFIDVLEEKLERPEFIGLARVKEIEEK